MLWNLVARVAAAVFCSLASLYVLRFFQQTGYNVARGYLRICKTCGFVCACAACVILGVTRIFIPAFSGLFLVLLTMLCAASELFSRAKLPLRFTPRANRIFCIDCLVLLAVCIFSPIYVVPLIPFASVPLSCLLLLPVDKAINKKYLKRAAARLNSATFVKVAITGSFGKTSVKNILTRMLSNRFKTYCTPGSFNTPMGIAKFVNNSLPSDAEAAVFELGAKKRGDIAYLCKILMPRYGILTGIERQHMSTFKTVDNIIATKCELFDYIPEEGLCVVNADNVYTRRFNLSKCPSTTAGQKGETRVADVKLSSSGTSFKLTVGGETELVTTRLLGCFNAVNIALAAALAFGMGVSAREIFDTVPLLEPTPHRLELIEGANGAAIIDDSYNANISGVKGAVEVLGQFSGCRYAITQGIVELGHEQFDVNFGLGKELAKVCDVVITLGQNSKALSQGVRAFDAFAEVYSADTVEDAVKKLSPRVSAGDVILFQNDLPDSMI